MFPFKRFGSKRHQPAAPASQKPSEPIGSRLDERLDWFHRAFDRCFDVVIHPFTACLGKPCAVIYISGIITTDMLQNAVLRPLMSSDFAQTNSEFIEAIMSDAKWSVSSRGATSELHEAVAAVLEGEVVLLIDNEERLIIFPFTSYDKRSVDEAKNEVVVRGPREAFVEDLKTNIGLLRRRIKTTSLKLERMQLGSYTRTHLVLAYIEDLCRPEFIAEARTRLQHIQIDGVLESSYLEELIKDNPLSPFPQLQNTERPDTVSAALLEGRLAIFTDGTPIVLLAPVTFPLMFQSAEDYYQNYYSATWIRWIRFLFMLVSMLFPSFYIALTTYHPEMIPASLLFSVAAARDPVPFPAIIEAFMMEISFEALREASIRIPSAIGQAVSILGTLVIGEAAVRAGIVSAPMVIIVSLTGISSFIIPSYSLGLTLRLLRFPVMILAGSFGLLGLTLGTFLIMLHIVSLKSFGVPYLSPLAPLSARDAKDVVFRAPWWMMKNRPFLFGAQNAQRQQLNNDRRFIPKEEEGD